MKSENKDGIGAFKSHQKSSSWLYQSHAQLFTKLEFKSRGNLEIAN